MSATHEAILFSFERNPEGVDFYFIPADSGLSINLIGAIRTLDGLYINTDRSPKTDEQWKAWEYANAAMTEEARHLDHKNEHNQNRFHAKLLPFQIGTQATDLKFDCADHFRLVRSGMIL